MSCCKCLAIFKFNIPLENLCSSFTDCQKKNCVHAFNVIFAAILFGLYIYFLSFIVPHPWTEEAKSDVQIPNEDIIALILLSLVVLFQLVVAVWLIFVTEDFSRCGSSLTNKRVLQILFAVYILCFLLSVWPLMRIGHYVYLCVYPLILLIICCFVKTYVIKINPQQQNGNAVLQPLNQTPM